MSVNRKGKQRTVATKKKSTATKSKVKSVGQNLHGANFEVTNSSMSDENPGDPSTEDSGPEQVVHDRQIVELLDQIDEGFRADDSTNLEKLNIARKYGPVLLELKLFVAHGQFMKTLKERFPQVSYPKCNRWMAIAKKEAEVAAAIEKFPDVAWGPKKMLDYLLNPNEDLGVDEEESSDFLSEDNLTEEPLLPPWDRKKIVLDHTSPYALGALNKKFAAKVNRYQRQVAKKAATVNQVTRGHGRPAETETESVVQPATVRNEYEVEVRMTFKLTVPNSVSVEEINNEIQTTEPWIENIDTSFESMLSDLDVVVNHVQPWTVENTVTQQ